MGRGDVIAGLSVAGLLLPEAVAYSEIAGLPPQRAILAGVVGCMAYAWLGRSRFAIVAPTSASAAILAAALATLPSGEDRGAAVTVIVAMIGIVFLLAAASRLGALANFISRPVLRGFAFGLAASICVHQLPVLVGAKAEARNVFALAAEMIGTLPLWNPVSVCIGAAALAALLILRRRPSVPGPFLVLVVGVASALAFPLSKLGVAAVGPFDVLPGPPSWPLLDWVEYSGLLRLSLPLVLILFAESWGTVRTLALRRGDALEANRELGALGAANLASALLQGMPVGAGFSAASASEAAGAATRATALIAAVSLAILALSCGPLIAQLPRPILAAVVIAALAPSLHPGPFVRLWRLGRDEYVALGAAAAVLLLGVLDGMLAAIALSVAALMQRLAAPHVARLGRLKPTHAYVDLARHGDAEVMGGVAIWRPAEPLFFANAERALKTIADRSRADPTIRGVIVSLEESFDLDSTAFDLLIEFDAGMRAGGTPVQFARVHDRIRDMFAWPEAYDMAARSSFSVYQAVEAVRARLDQGGDAASTVSCRQECL